MKIQLRDGLPFVPVVLTHAGRQLTLQQVLLDTGSVGTLFAADQLLLLGLRLEPHDSIRRIYGVGGAEFVVLTSPPGSRSGARCAPYLAGNIAEVLAELQRGFASPTHAAFAKRLAALAELSR